MKINEIREKFLNFQIKNKHKIIPSSSIIPTNDPTTLFVGSGMQPLIPYLFGKEHPCGKRISNSQKSFRSGDIEEIGDNRHTTFFEMLGNWSFGDYFKKEQIQNFFTFLTSKEEGLNLDPKKLYVTVFSGSEKYNIPKDLESVNIWKNCFSSVGIDTDAQEIISEENGDKVGMEEGKHIFYYNSEKNWWSRCGTPETMPSGELGGSDSEVFYDFGEENTSKNYFHLKPHPNTESGRFLEIGNSVFMEYVKENNSFKKLKNKNVDFGGGLERLAMVAQNKTDIFLIDIFKNSIEVLGGINIYNKHTKSCRIILDHLRASIFIISSGVLPSNTDKGYILRRILRRLIYHLQYTLNNFAVLPNLVTSLIYEYKNIYKELNDKNIIKTIEEEAKKFLEVIKKGTSKFENTYNQKKIITAKDAFELFTIFGFPFDVTQDLAEKKNIKIDKNEFLLLMKKHKEVSKKGITSKFKSGLSGGEREVICYHTATHLLHQALKDILGNKVNQKGSNITKERLRFDFSFDRKLTDEEKMKIEDLVNKKIKSAMKVDFVTMSFEEAKKTKALHNFDDKYPDIVTIYNIGDYSCEFCSGPHVKNTIELGVFKIKKEESVSTGVRRIKGLLL